MSLFFYYRPAHNLLDAFFFKFLNQAIGEFPVVVLQCVDVRLALVTLHI